MSDIESVLISQTAVSVNESFATAGDTLKTINTLSKSAIVILCAVIAAVLLLFVSLYFFIRKIKNVIESNEIKESKFSEDHCSCEAIISNFHTHLINISLLKKNLDGFNNEDLINVCNLYLLKIRLMPVLGTSLLNSYFDHCLKHKLVNMTTEEKFKLFVIIYEHCAFGGFLTVQMEKNFNALILALRAEDINNLYAHYIDIYQTNRDRNIENFSERNENVIFIMSLIQGSARPVLNENSKINSCLLINCLEFYTEKTRDFTASNKFAASCDFLREKSELIYGHHYSINEITFSQMRELTENMWDMFNNVSAKIFDLNIVESSLNEFNKTIKVLKSNVNCNKDALMKLFRLTLCVNDTQYKTLIDICYTTSELLSKIYHISSRLTGDYGAHSGHESDFLIKSLLFDGEYNYMRERANRSHWVTETTFEEDPKKLLTFAK